MTRKQGKGDAQTSFFTRRRIYIVSWIYFACSRSTYDRGEHQSTHVPNALSQFYEDRDVTFGVFLRRKRCHITDSRIWSGSCSCHEKKPVSQIRERKYCHDNKNMYLQHRINFKWASYCTCPSSIFLSHWPWRILTPHGYIKVKGKVNAVFGIDAEGGDSCGRDHGRN